MARTESNMLPLGTKAPDFELLDSVSNSERALKNLKGETGTLIMFICNHCPFVMHVTTEIAQIAKDYLPKGIKCIAISSNDVEKYPQDSPDLMKKNAVNNGFIFPYLYDETQMVAKSYDAACTPDFFLFDKALKLVYRGQLDDSRPGNGVEVNGKDLRLALDHLILGKSLLTDQKPSIGCNIKWKS